MKTVQFITINLLQKGDKVSTWSIRDSGLHVNGTHIYLNGKNTTECDFYIWKVSQL